jgi:soluble lytic murein transglycosylase-like protein
MRQILLGMVPAVLIAAAAATAGAAPALKPDAPWQAVCGAVDRVAAANRLSAAVLTRILWQESRFRSDAVSPKGAEGVAQFMPPTALDRGLANPWEPGPAIAAAGRLLAELTARFGNIGLAAAAYNAGARRIDNWLHATGSLPAETRSYVQIVTGMTAEDWATAGAPAGAPAPADANGADCAETIAALPQAAPAWPGASLRQTRLDHLLAHALRLAEDQGR